MGGGPEHSVFKIFSLNTLASPKGMGSLGSLALLAPFLPPPALPTLASGAPKRLLAGESSCATEASGGAPGLCSALLFSLYTI